MISNFMRNYGILSAILLDVVSKPQYLAVTPFMGVWIEISMLILKVASCFKSHPLWVCGLKSDDFDNKPCECAVTPFMGVWIEIIIVKVRE